MDTPVIEVIHLLASKDVSSIPIVDSEGVLYNIYESVDILTLIKGGIYTDLTLTVGEALLRRPSVCFILLRKFLVTKNGANK